MTVLSVAYTATTISYNFLLLVTEQACLPSYLNLDVASHVLVVLSTVIKKVKMQVKCEELIRKLIKPLQMYNCHFVV